MDSADLFSRLWGLIGPLLGVLVGGFISALTTRSLERSRWRHDRQEKLAAQKRDALAAALEWMDPMRNAKIAASRFLAAAIHGDIDQETLSELWPNLGGELKDLPGHQRALLPDDIYPRGHHIVFEIKKLKNLAMRSAQSHSEDRPPAGLEEGYPRLETVADNIKSLEDDLRKAYLATFE